MNGQALKEAGQSDVIAADTSVMRGYAQLVVEGVEWWGSDGETFTSDDVRLYIGMNYPERRPHSPNLLPAVIGGLAAAGRIEAVGWAKSPRTSRRSGWGRVWRLAPKTPPAGATPVAAAGVEGAGRGGAANPCQPSPSGRSST